MFSDVVYDLECLPDFFCAGFQPVDAPDDVGFIFEISERRNDAAALRDFLTRVDRLIGFNCMAYDWPMLSHFLTLYSNGGMITPAVMRAKNDEIFASQRSDRFKHIIWQPMIPQIDLFMLHHLERFKVSLKQVEFIMRSRRVRDMPFDPNKPIGIENFDTALSYNAHDIRETKGFYIRSKADIDFRESLGPEWLNYNDGKIGKKFFEQELMKAGVQLYEDGAKRQTRRPHGVTLGDVILPLVRFTRPENNALLADVKSRVIEEWETKGGMHVVMDLDGFHIDIKLGGIHGSLKRAAVHERDGIIRDVDVTSYYPSIAIEHGIYPQHLGPEFCRIYRRLRDRRVSLPKTHPDRATLKFALNVPFGDSNSEFGIFFDPAYMLAITVNGQLMLCMLAEQFANVPGIRLIQVNTDGVTIQYKPEHEEIVQQICAWWATYTRFTLEHVNYRSMHIRDANSYLAVTTDGKIKRKGAYDYKFDVLYWAKDHSMLVVPKAAEAAMLHDIDVTDFITNHRDAWDFLLFTKGDLYLNDGTPLERRQRYYVSETGQGMHVRHKPLTGKTEKRRIGIHAEGLATAVKTGPKQWRCSACGEAFPRKAEFELHNKALHCWKITPCNEFDGKIPPDLDYRFYIAEAEKLVI